MPTSPPSPADAVSPPLHLRLRAKVDAATEKLALRAALTAAHLLGLAAGCLLRDLPSKNDPLAESLAQLKEADLRARLAWQMVEILGARLDKIPDRHRPYFTPAQRFQILEIKSFLGWNRSLVARLFRVCSNTISNWEQHTDPVSKTVGSLVHVPRDRFPASNSKRTPIAGLPSSKSQARGDRAGGGSGRRRRAREPYSGGASGRARKCPWP